MIFKEVDFQGDNENLLKLIEDNCTIARGVRNEIRNAEKLRNQNTVNSVSYDVVGEEKAPVVKKVIDEEFEDQVKYYLQDYSKLDVGFSDDDLYDVLPSKNSYRYKDIMLRLMAESVKEIKQLNELFLGDPLSIEEMEEVKSLVVTEKRKIDFINGILNKKETKTTKKKEEEKNSVIFAPTTGGNIRVIEEMKDIDASYYPAFKELLDSIIDGSFKGVKAFNNNVDLNGVSEVKGHGVRIVFKRISKKTYALVTAFVKRSTNERGYRDSLKSKVADFRVMHDRLKEKCNDPEFMQQNELYLEELYNILGQNDKNPQMKKGEK